MIAEHVITHCSVPEELLISADHDSRGDFRKLLFRALDMANAGIFFNDLMGSIKAKTSGQFIYQRYQRAEQPPTSEESKTAAKNPKMQVIDVVEFNKW